MQYYESVYRELDLPDVARRVAVGSIHLRPGATAPFISDGFPPALIPLWSDDLGYYGYWRHWFCDRWTPIVRLKLGDHMFATEVARTFEQFVILMTLQMLCSGVFSESQSRALLEQCGLTNSDFDAMLAIAEATGDDPVGLADHPRFVHNLPLVSVVDVSMYRGDFPVADLLTTPIRQDICGFEVSLPVLQQITDPDDAPWLAPLSGYRHQKVVFQDCLDDGDLAGAWLSLNSPAWTAEDARVAIRRLADQAKDKTFDVVAHAWISERQGALA